MTYWRWIVSHSFYLPSLSYFLNFCYSSEPFWTVLLEWMKGCWSVSLQFGLKYLNNLWVDFCSDSLFLDFVCDLRTSPQISPQIYNLSNIGWWTWWTVVIQSSALLNCLSSVYFLTKEMLKICMLTFHELACMSHFHVLCVALLLGAGTADLYFPSYIHNSPSSHYSRRYVQLDSWNIMILRWT